MSSVKSNIFSSSEGERLKRLLKNPEKDLEEITSFLENKVEEKSNQLRKSDEKYQSLLDGLTHVGIGIDIVNKDYEVLFQNQILKERFGDCIGKNCFKSYMDLEKPCEFCPMEEALKYNKVDRTELTAADGRSYELISAPYPNRDGTIDKVAEVVIDITERKVTEQKLRESEEKYKILTEQSLMGIFIIQEGRLKYINQAVSDMNGYTNEEMLNWSGLDIAKTIYNEDLETIMNSLKRSEQGDLDEYSKSNFRIITKSGKLKWVEEYNRRIEFQGAPASLVTLIDITNRIESEYKLRESEERYRSLINNISDIIYELDINGKCTYASNQLFEISGFHPDEMIGQKVFEYLHPDDFLIVAEKMKETFSSGTRISADFRLRHKNGYYVPVSSNFNVIDTNGDLRLIGVIRDNTEKKKAEDAFLEEKKFTEIAINAQRDTFFIFEPSTSKAVRWNHAFREISGYSDEDISIMKAPDSYYNEDDLQQATSAIEKIYIEGEALIEMNLITKDGNEIQFEYLGSSINDDEGNLKYIVATGRDITERKQTDEALRESENFLKKAQKIAYLGHWELNPLTLVVSGSDELFNIFDLSQDEVNLDSFIEVVHPDDREYDLYHIRRGMELGESWDIEHRLITKEGTEKWVHALGEAVKNEKSEIIMLLGTIQDITFQKKIEQELKVSEEKYRSLFDNSPIGIGLSTIEGKVLDSNDTMVEITGYSVESLNNAGINAIYADPDERSKILKLLEEEGYLRDYEAKLRRKDNTEFLGSISLDLIELGGRKIIQISMRDITKSKNAELELIKLNNLKSELLRRTSHELKTPLVSIKGFSDLLLQVHRGKLDAFVISILNEIKQGCLRLENLIADILKTSELESGTIQLRKSEEDLSFLIRLCVNEIKGLSILRNQRINLEIPENLETMFEKEQVHQVVSNLLNNAVKYTPPGGLIEIKSEIKNESIITSIKDNGIGISDEEKERIFKQFGKVERYGQGLDIISEGSGLGLFISKKIIELHGGKIWVESEGKHKGSTFYFSLPLVKNS